MAELKIEPNPKTMRSASILVTPAVHSKSWSGRLGPAFNFFFPLNSVLGLGIGVYRLWNPGGLRSANATIGPGLCLPNQRDGSVVDWHSRPVEPALAGSAQYFLIDCFYSSSGLLQGEVVSHPLPCPNAHRSCLYRVRKNPGDGLGHGLRISHRD